MFAKWYGTTDLVNNEAFWQDCLEIYTDKTVTLPFDDTTSQRQLISEMVKCPPDSAASAADMTG